MDDFNYFYGADGRADLRQSESLELVRCPIYKNKKLSKDSFYTLYWSGRWDSNPQQPAWKAGALAN